MIEVLTVSVALFGGVILPLAAIGKWLKTHELALGQVDL